MVARLKYLELSGLNTLFFTLKTTWDVYMYEGMDIYSRKVVFLCKVIFSWKGLLVKGNIEKTWQFMEVYVTSWENMMVQCIPLSSVNRGALA